MYSDVITSTRINSSSVHMYNCVCFIQNVSNIQQPCPSYVYILNLQSTDSDRKWIVVTTLLLYNHFDVTFKSTGCHADFNSYKRVTFSIQSLLSCSSYVFEVNGKTCTCYDSIVQLYLCCTTCTECIIAGKMMNMYATTVELLSINDSNSALKASCRCETSTLLPK